MDLRIDVIPVNGWSGYLSAGNVRTVSLTGDYWRVDPRTVGNLSLGQEFKLANRRSLLMEMDLLNVFDEKGIYNFLSTFGGTHVIPQRTLAARLKYRF